MNLSMFGSSNPNKILRNLMEQPCNNYCIDCGESSASNVDCTHYTFVCVACSAIHREIGDKIKSVGVSTFTPEEIERLKETSNDDFNNTWMSGFKRGDQPLLPASSEETRRAFIFAKYRQKRWHKDTPKTVTQSHRTMFPTEEDDSENDEMNDKTPKNDYYSSESQNQQQFDNYGSYNDTNNYNGYNGNQQQVQNNFPRGNPFGNNSQQQQNIYNQNSYQPQQNTQNLQNKNLSNSSSQLTTSSKNAPFQRHKSSDHTHKKNKQPFQQQEQPQFQPQFQPQNQMQAQSQPQFQQPNQNDLLIDLMSPQPQSSNMQSAIDDIFGAPTQQPQYQQQFTNSQFQSPSQNLFQQQQNSFQQPQQQQNLFQQPQQQQNLFQQPQQQQNSFQQPQQQQNSFPHKKNNQKKGQQKKQTQQVQNNSLDDIIDFSYSANQPQNSQNQQVDDLFNFGLPNDSAPSQINDDELFNFNNPQIAAEQQQLMENRRQLKEAMVNISDDDMKNINGNNSVEKLRNVGLGVQDSPTFMAKALIASGYCSQPVNQPMPRMGMQPQQPMYYGAYQGYQANQNQYYKPQ